MQIAITLMGERMGQLWNKFKRTHTTWSSFLSESCTFKRWIRRHFSKDGNGVGDKCHICFHDTFAKDLLCHFAEDYTQNDHQVFRGTMKPMITAILEEVCSEIETNLDTSGSRIACGYNENKSEHFNIHKTAMLKIRGKRRLVALICFMK